VKGFPNKYVPRSIQNIFDRLEAKNERDDKKSSKEELQNVFEVKIYETINPYTKSKVAGQSSRSNTSLGQYHYYRARSLAGHHEHMPSPDLATSEQQYEVLRNSHFQAILKKDTEENLPVMGDVWNATYLGGNMVTLNYFVRSGKFEPKFSEEKPSNSFNSSNPTTTVAEANENPPATTQSTGDQQSPTTSNGSTGALPVVDSTQKKILEFISKKEGSYNATNNGTDPQGNIRNSIGGTSYVAPGFVTKTKQRDDQKLLSTMTIKEIINLQKGKNPFYNPNAANKRTLFAVGAYQIIPKTMPVAILDSGLSESDIFNESNQDKLGLALIYGRKRPKLRDYLKGSNSVTLEEAHIDFALEWASVPKPDGKTAYSGTGNRAGHTAAEVQSVLKEVRELNIKNGFTV